MRPGDDRIAIGRLGCVVSLEIADVREPGPPPPEAERIAVRQRAYSLTPTGHYPRAGAVAATMAACISTEQYLWGLDRLLDGITPAATAADA